MNRLLLFAGVCVCGLQAQTFDRTKPPTSPPPRPYKLPPTYETKLPNGLTVVLADDTRVPMITARLAFIAGNKRDPKDIPGLAGSVAMMLTQGTKTRTYVQLAEQLDDIGASLTAATSADALTISGSALSSDTARLIELVADVARNATFPADELALHIQNRKQSVILQHGQPATLANEEFRKRIFGDNPYAHIGPTLAAVDKVDLKSLTTFRDTWLVPNNAFLILVGKLPARAETLRLITTQFGAWQQKALPAIDSGKIPAPARQIVLVDRPGSVQADVRIGRVAISQTDKDYFSVIVGATVEGGGSHSRLFDDIREKKGFAYDAHTEPSAFADSGVYSVVTQVRNEVVGDALEAVVDHMQRLAAEPVEKDELSDAKSSINGLYLFRLEPQEGLANQLANIKVMNLPGDYLETYTTKVNSVEPGQIEAAAKRYMAPENSAVIVVGDASKISEQVGKLGKVEIVKPNQ
jgi:zinc protease